MPKEHTNSKKQECKNAPNEENVENRDDIVCSNKLINLIDVKYNIINFYQQSIAN